jgi:hypothetical protein
MLTPATREFLIRLEELLDSAPAPGLDRERVAVTTADAIARVVLPHRDPGRPDVELEVDDRTVRIEYGAEPLLVRGHAFALQFVDALLAGRVELEIRHGPLWRTTRSYLDRATQPFRTTRMPVPSLRPRTERVPAGFGS